MELKQLNKLLDFLSPLEVEDNLIKAIADRYIEARVDHKRGFVIFQPSSLQSDPFRYKLVQVFWIFFILLCCFFQSRRLRGSLKKCCCCCCPQILKSLFGTVQIATNLARIVQLVEPVEKKIERATLRQKLYAKV
jgi:hypothetical protein